MDTNQQQAMTLAADANATKNKLLREALTLHLGRTPTDPEISAGVVERRQPGAPVVWVCWGERAVAVRTDCRARVKDCRYYLSWFWRTLTKEDN